MKNMVLKMDKRQRSMCSPSCNACTAAGKSAVLSSVSTEPIASAVGFLFGKEVEGNG